MVQRCKAALEEGKPLRALDSTGDDLQAAARLSVPLGQAAADRDQPRRSRHRRRRRRASRRAAAKTGLTAFLARAATRAVAVCAKIELEIAQLEPADAAAFLADLGLTESGLDRVIRASYDLLGYMSFFTVGEDECRAWSIPRGTPAQLARRRDPQRHRARLHPRRSRRLRRAHRRGSMAACRDHGEVRLEGKEYVVQDGDIINFRFAT